MGLVILAASIVRQRNPADNRHSRFQCLAWCRLAGPKAEIGENCPKVTSPCGDRAKTGAAVAIYDRLQIRSGVVIGNGVIGRPAADLEGSRDWRVSRFSRW